MSWTCPACRTQIQHEQPQQSANVVYRCHVCHFELVVDEDTTAGNEERPVHLRPQQDRRQRQERRQVPRPGAHIRRTND